MKKAGAPEAGHRILYWSEAYWPFIGGTEVASVNLLRGLLERGHRALVMTERYDGDLPEQEVHEGVQILRFRFRDAVESGNPAAFFELLGTLLSAAREFAPDLIHLGLPGPSVIFCLELGRRLSVPMVFTHQMSGMWTESMAGDQLIPRAASRAEWVVFPSEAMRSEALELGIRPRRSSVVYNGMRPNLGSMTPLPGNPPVLLGLGRLSREKGFDLLVEAAGILARQGLEFRAILAGEGPERPGLEKHARELGLNGHLDFLGWVSPEAVPELLERATLLVAPSRAESFGLSALEAHGAGRPVVATDVGGLGEVVVNGETGVLVEPDDPEALASAVASLLEDPDLMMRMGRQARLRVSKKFSIESQIGEYARIYDAVTGSDRDD